MNRRASVTVDESTARCRGYWTARYVDDIEAQFARAAWPDGRVVIDVAGIESLDTSGAWLLHRQLQALRDRGIDVTLAGADTRTRRLLELVAGSADAARDPVRPHQPGFLEDVGRQATGQLAQYRDFLHFVGRTAVAIGRLLLRPWRIRFRLIAAELQSAGWNAMPIVGLLAFLMGIVIAYQGGIVLADYGASIYVADIVGLSTVRELAPLITAIIVAGRTGSAYTAQIGTMVVTEEVDALRSIGIPPLEMLVLPKLAALVIALPLLTVFADVMGLFGGLLMANTMLGINATTFISRLSESLTVSSYLSGIGKAPVFAGIIAMVGCFQGFRVRGGAGSVGRQTTVSVVQSIFLVLIVDAAFSVAFSKLGI
ncbi:MAG: MlaE family lipid ABC transporter permease subunit [Woeseiaceae bacterium]|nr:MlaE family lipid ABC transporter permease subunit [Woeseiaceae bacterium]